MFLSVSLCRLHLFPKAAITESHGLGGLNHRILFSQSSGGWKLGIKVLAGLVPSEASFSPWLVDGHVFLVSLRGLLSVLACVQHSSFYKVHQSDWLRVHPSSLILI